MRFYPLLIVIALLGSIALIAWHPRVPPADGRLVIPIPPGDSVVWEITSYRCRPGGRGSVVDALEGLWTRSILRRLSSGAVGGDLAESWRKYQVTLVLVDPAGKLPDGRPYSLAATRGYLTRLQGRDSDFLRALSFVDQISDTAEAILTSSPGVRDRTSLSQYLQGRGKSPIVLLKLTLGTWDKAAGEHLREVLGTGLIHGLAGGVPEPVSSSAYAFSYVPSARPLSDGTPASQRLGHQEIWVEPGTDTEFPDALFRPDYPTPGRLDSRGFPVTYGPCRFGNPLPEGGLQLECLPNSPETDLPRDLLFPARVRVPLGGLRPLPEFATIVETPPVDWPPAGLAANREAPGTLRRPGRETIAVIFDATARLLEEPEIRRGLAGSIRREHLLEEVYRGRGRLADSILDPADVAPETLPKMACLGDPIAAGKAFGEAGFSRTDALPGAGLCRNGVPLTVDLVIPDDRADLAAAGVQVARDWASAGVQVRVVLEGAVPSRWAAPHGPARAFVRAINPDETPRADCAATPQMQKCFDTDRFLSWSASSEPLREWAARQTGPLSVRRSVARLFADEVAGVPLCRPDREFRIVPAPAETPPLNDRLAKVIDALPPPAPATDGTREPLPPFLR